MNTVTEVAPVIMASQQPRASLAMRRMLRRIALGKRANGVARGSLPLPVLYGESRRALARRVRGEALWQTLTRRRKKVPSPQPSPRKRGAREKKLIASSYSAACAFTSADT